MADHRKDLEISAMVYNRLPFLAETTANTTTLSEFILEVMYELEICFKIDKIRPDGELDTWVGWEDKYSIAQRVVVAELVSVYILMMKTVAGTVGTADGVADGTTSPKFLKSTKAGSVAVEWEQLDNKKGGGLIADAGKLLSLYQSAARRKARALGCNISWDNEDLQVDCLHCDKELPPFRVITSEACSSGLNGLTPKERI